MKNKKKRDYSKMPVVEAKLRMLADAARDAADAYRDDPVRKACKKASVTQAVSGHFFYEVLDELCEKMLKVDNIVHGWEVEWIGDLADPKQHSNYKKFQKFLKLDK